MLTNEIKARLRELAKVANCGRLHIGYRPEDKDGDGFGFDIYAASLRVARVLAIARVYRYRDNRNGQSLQKVPYEKAHAIADFIAAADPTTILKLLDEIAELEKERAGLRQAYLDLKF